MILPGQLSELLELALPERVLLVDLRSPTDFERSHIHGAANIRAPASFLREAPLEAIEAALMDSQSRRAFQGWQLARCIVFYSRALDSPRECPAAEILPERFAARGWIGEVYLLKGHYREFSASFGKHIGGARMNKEGKEYAESLQRRMSATKEDIIRSEEGYIAWREAREAEDQGTRAYPPLHEEKREAMQTEEEDLERAFRAKFPHMYAPEQRSKDGFSDAKAQMVPYLDRGLTKMRETSYEPYAAVPQRAPGHEKTTERYFGERHMSSGEYVEVSREAHEAPVGDGEQKGGRGGGLINRVFRRA